MNYKITSLFFLVLIAIFVSACGPTYITKNEYIPPKSPSAVFCLQRCEVKKNSCQNSCNAKNNVCKTKAGQMAIRTLPDQLTQYTQHLEVYTVEQRRYHSETRERELELNRLEMDYDVYKDRCAKDKTYCSRKDEIKRNLSSLRYSSVKSPERPEKPTLASETKRHETKCTTDCGCSGVYDTCYTSCGGRIIPRKICTSNCPAKK